VEEGCEGQGFSVQINQDEDEQQSVSKTLPLFNGDNIIPAGLSIMSGSNDPKHQPVIHLNFEPFERGRMKVKVNLLYFHYFYTITGGKYERCSDNPRIQ
jgi:hypothetical protein